MKACSVPMPPGEIGTSVARLCVTWTRSTLRSDCSIPNASRKNQIAVKRSAQSPACQSTTRRRYSVRSERIAMPWRMRSLNSATWSRSQKKPITPKIARTTSSTAENSGLSAKNPKSKPGNRPSEPTPGRTPSVSA
jgi:hypothetical protein